MRKVKVLTLLCAIFLLGMETSSCENDNEPFGIVELIQSTMTMNLSRSLDLPCVVCSVEELEDCKAESPDAEGEEGWEYLRSIDYSRYMVIFIQEPYQAQNKQYRFSETENGNSLLEHSYSIKGKKETFGIIDGIGPGVGVVVNKKDKGEIEYKCVKTTTSICHSPDYIIMCRK
ncbi:hypothetical protein H8744_09260 [Oscillospiraceae bacterium N12]|jgi:hypothetical protein|uniref:Uncharacterized protein n=1 Tax=Jilunia laotingensis TaxID=2763675 RepID=A0A926IPL9_9BACT|nr:hypothetical protein [Jilunia laotingensis]MBC8593429.1 hypothetical protein [Jilunia laotingensis]